MGIGFYPHLAWDSIRKNRRFYLPYILTCTGMVMMFYIIAFLAGDPLLKTIRGGSFMAEMLGMGTYVIMIFAVLFLFYTNSFLMKRRKKEFGLYYGSAVYDIEGFWRNICTSFCQHGETGQNVKAG